MKIVQKINKNVVYLFVVGKLIHFFMGNWEKINHHSQPRSIS